MEKINITKFFGKVFDPKVFFKETALKINELIDYITGTVKPYKTYVAILNGGGGNAPTQTILENTIGSAEWTRPESGTYDLVFSDFSGISATNTTILIGSLDDQIAGGYVSQTAALSSSGIRVYTGTIGGGIADVFMNNTTIEVRVYN